MHCANETTYELLLNDHGSKLCHEWQLVRAQKEHKCDNRKINIFIMITKNVFLRVYFILNSYKVFVINEHLSVIMYKC